MTDEERKDYLKYIENYTINDLADIFNTQNFVIQDKDKFNEILLYYHFKQNEEIEQSQQENKKYKELIDKTIKYINKYESIKAYYEYIDEDGYDEYNYDEDFKKEILDILKGVE